MPAIVVNGESRAVVSTSLEELIRELDLRDQKFAVELNRQVIPRSKFTSTAISDGDTLEVVTFVGGG